MAYDTQLPVSALGISTTINSASRERGSTMDVKHQCIFSTKQQRQQILSVIYRTVEKRYQIDMLILSMSLLFHHSDIFNFTGL